MGLFFFFFLKTHIFWALQNPTADSDVLNPFYPSFLLSRRGAELKHPAIIIFIQIDHSFEAAAVKAITPQERQKFGSFE